ncbi:MAG TPA: hypothetical protein VFN88_07640 [Caulobacteraceae bacterium]|nr:hypothetical protein [Caulobacteraceae bacterium]
MDDNVVKLPRRDGGETVWACGCGCTVHYHHADGRVVCSHCDTLADGAHGEWRLRLPEEPAAPAALDSSNFKVIDLSDAESFLRRQIATAKPERPVAIAVVIYADGSASTWGDDISTEDRRGWVHRKMAEATARLTREA